MKEALTLVPTVDYHQLTEESYVPSSETCFKLFSKTDTNHFCSYPLQTAHLDPTLAAFGSNTREGTRPVTSLSVSRVCVVVTQLFDVSCPVISLTSAMLLKTTLKTVKYCTFVQQFLPKEPITNMVISTFQVHSDLKARKKTHCHGFH